MPKYKVELQAIVTATVWVAYSDETEAKSIAESAWRPMCDTSGNAGIDPTVEAIYDYEVDRHTASTQAFSVVRADDLSSSETLEQV